MPLRGCVELAPALTPHNLSTQVNSFGLQGIHTLSGLSRRLKMEAAGVALAILPLIINQLDNYVQGLETIKSFGAKRYRRELESYSSSLGTQQAIFVNTLERALDGVVEYEDGLDELRNNPLGDLWKRKSLQASLHEKLGRDFYPFNQMMVEIATLLEELSRRLGLDKNIALVSIFLSSRDRLPRAGLMNNFDHTIELSGRPVRYQEGGQEVQRHFLERHLPRSLRSYRRSQ